MAIVLCKKLVFFLRVCYDTFALSAIGFTFRRFVFE